MQKWKKYIAAVVLAYAVMPLLSCVSGTHIQKQAEPAQNEATIFEGTWIGQDYYGSEETLTFNGKSVSNVLRRKDGTEFSYQETFTFNEEMVNDSLIGVSLEPRTITIGMETRFYHINGNELKLSIPINSENYYELKSLMDSEDYAVNYFRTFIREQ